MDSLINQTQRGSTTANIMVLVLLVALVGVSLLYMGAKSTLDENQSEIEAYETNREIIEFTELFIEKVLEGEGEVDFEDRLQLENAVRAIGRPDITELWERFTNESETEEEAQQYLVELLKALIKNIQSTS